MRKKYKDVRNMYMQTNLGNSVNPGDSCTCIYDVRCDTNGEWTTVWDIKGLFID